MFKIIKNDVSFFLFRFIIFLNLKVKKIEGDSFNVNICDKYAAFCIVFSKSYGHMQGYINTCVCTSILPIRFSSLCRAHRFHPLHNISSLSLSPILTRLPSFPFGRSLMVLLHCFVLLGILFFLFCFLSSFVSFIHSFH